MDIRNILKKATHRMATLVFAFLELAGLPRVGGDPKASKEKK
jgi:hypothetical protein